MVRILTNKRLGLDCVSIGTTSDTQSEAVWALGQVVRQMRGEALIINKITRENSHHFIVILGLNLRNHKQLNG